MEEFNRKWPYLKEGRTPPSVDTGNGFTLKLLSNDFQYLKKMKMEGGELSIHSLSEYHRTCEKIVEFFGPRRRVDDLRLEDFESIRPSPSKGCCPTERHAELFAQHEPA